ncbi:MAG: hypothetical protein M3167_06505 [Acidobacteriota bacterium]|nr:hypothetical protein [Acidobacteriota bacterium]
MFRTKAGKGKEVATMFKKASGMMPKEGVRSRRLLSDTVGAYWTIVMETEVEKLQTYFDLMTSRPENPEIENVMKGYADLVESGYREIFKVE